MIAAMKQIGMGPRPTARAGNGNPGIVPPWLQIPVLPTPTPPALPSPRSGLADARAAAVPTQTGGARMVPLPVPVVD